VVSRHRARRREAVKTEEQQAASADHPRLIKLGLLSFAQSRRQQLALTAKPHEPLSRPRIHELRVSHCRVLEVVGRHAPHRLWHPGPPQGVALVPPRAGRTRPPVSCLGAPRCDHGPRQRLRRRSYGQGMQLSVDSSRRAIDSRDLS